MVAVGLNNFSILSNQSPYNLHLYSINPNILNMLLLPTINIENIHITINSYA